LGLHFIVFVLTNFGEFIRGVLVFLDVIVDVDRSSVIKLLQIIVSSRLNQRFSGVILLFKVDESELSLNFEVFRGAGGVGLGLGGRVNGATEDFSVLREGGLELVFGGAGQDVLGEQVGFVCLFGVQFS
jgi:hypothetical protein